MPQLGPVAYAATTDLFGTAGYLRDPNSAQNSAIATILLNNASRFIDKKCGRFFYNDGFYTRTFNGQPLDEITVWPDMFGKIGTIAPCAVGATSLTFTSAPLGGGPAPAAGDVFALDIGAPIEQVTVNSVSGSGPYTLTIAAPGTKFAHVANGAQNPIATTMIVQFLFYENQPQFINGVSQWLTVPGDGLTPGLTNWMLAPTNPEPFVTTGGTAQTPWYGFDMPAIPVSNTTYIPTPRPGARTIALSMNWGWPAVPDLIKDLTLKMTSRAWQHRQAAWSGDAADAQTAGQVNMSHHFDSKDEDLLIGSGFVRWAV